LGLLKMPYLGAAEDVILLSCCGCHTLGLLRMPYLGAAEEMQLHTGAELFRNVVNCGITERGCSY
jgi:hypothetical protein